MNPRTGTPGLELAGLYADLAEQAELDRLQGIQDISLLLLESLAEPDFPLDADTAPLLDSWPRLVAAYRYEPAATLPAILDFLKHPALNLPLCDADIATLEALLTEDARTLPPGDGGRTAGSGADAPRGVEEYAAGLGQLAEQAGLDRLQGIQDISLLLLETLAEPDFPLDAGTAPLLDSWPRLVAAYRHEPAATLPAILDFLKHPALNLPLCDADIATLEALLTEDAHTAAAASWPPPLRQDAPDRAALDALPGAARELIELLLMQVCATDAELHRAGISGTAEDLAQARETLECLGSAAEAAGFGGLARLCGHCGANLQRFLDDAPAADPARLRLPREWLARVAGYLPQSTAPDAGRGVVAYLQDPAWPLPLPAATAADILERMDGGDLREIRGESTPTRPQTATAEDVSLAPPPDVNPQLLDILLQELPLHTRQFAESAQRLGAGGGLHDLETAQRLAHTLKGSANTVGIVGVAQLTHHLEDILSACSKEGRMPGPALARTLLDAADCLEAMGEALQGRGTPPAEARTVLQEVLDWANRIDRDGLSALDAPDAPAPAHPADTQDGAPAPPAPQDTPGTSTVRVPTAWIESLLRLSGESLVHSAQAHERLRRIKIQLQAMRAQFESLQGLGAELEELIDVRDWSGPAGGTGGQDFDNLEMDQYNELHTASRRLVEAAVDAREIGLDIGKELDALNETLGQQELLALDTQEAVMRTRLLTAESLLPRLQRSLRQTCRATGKQAGLTLAGGGMLLDGDTLEALADPLMHLLRNAVDHGLESPEERAVLGKPQAGRIVIAFEREGGQVRVHCQDDGRGLDLGAIHATAVKRGLLEPGQAATPRELSELILRPNFSTRERATQTSGRGVGMDAVRARVIALGGSLALDSTPGAGLGVELRIPLPLSRSLALLAQVGPHRVAIVNKGLEQIRHRDDAEPGGDPAWARLDGLDYPAATLRGLLRVPRRPDGDGRGVLLLARAADGATAVWVDALLDSWDVVVKPLGPYLAKPPGVIGATVLGDGAVVPVIDLPELLRGAAPGPAAAPWDGEAAARDGEPASGLPLALVVDDSLSNRRALEQLLGDVGYRVQTARDGVEATELLGRVRPDIVLTDLEMPRMNGIELAGHIRARPEYGRLPIVMITSRTTQRHRKLAAEAGIDAYLTKPVRDDDLLDRIRGLLETGLALP
ncbi:hybrid sensor histidine kinase/response regulator [Methylomagnum ishizawai]|uniref:hybrid sensor histidine kinase/response regulator n=1 Tax=Methylomagnum ishizawai TaxID=1760988 RepID=UPI001C322038|nr:response regulator [Methylomagnum ishizawai]BBL75270.1 hypothetical protein MishRS11D_23680 [Methylomagnum ishizawai]